MNSFSNLLVTIIQTQFSDIATYTVVKGESNHSDMKSFLQSYMRSLVDPLYAYVGFIHDPDDPWELR